MVSEPDCVHGGLASSSSAMVSGSVGQSPPMVNPESPLVSSAPAAVDDDELYGDQPMGDQTGNHDDKNENDDTEKNTIAPRGTRRNKRDDEHTNNPSGNAWEGRCSSTGARGRNH